MGLITKTEWEYDDECECQKCLDERHILQIDGVIKTLRQMQNAGIKDSTGMTYESMYHVLDLVKRRIREGNFPF